MLRLQAGPSTRGEIVVLHRRRERGDEIRLLGLQRPQRLKRARVEPAAGQMREVPKKRRRGLARRAPAPVRRKSSRACPTDRRSARCTARAAGRESSAASSAFTNSPIAARRAVAVDPDQLVVVILIEAPHLIDECASARRPASAGPRDSGVERLSLHERLQRGVRLRLRGSPHAAAGSSASLLTGGGEDDESTRARMYGSVYTNDVMRGELCKNRTHFAPRAAEVLH